MKLRSLMAVAALATLSAAPAFAHKLWLVPDAQSSASKQIADIVYGHDFPTPELIPDERVKLFEPIKLVTPDGDKAFSQGADYDNYHYSAAFELSDGNYLLRVDYKPTFWANGDKGWQMTDKKGYDGTVTYGEEAVMEAKAILQVGTSDDISKITEPVGQKLEIIPLANPASIKVGERFPIRVLFDGKPLKTGEVRARYEGFGGYEESAYVGRLDLKGEGSVVISHDGIWAIEVTHTAEHEDKDKADEFVAVSTLTFRIK